MIEIAINIGWFLIGLIILAGVVYLAIWVIEQFIYPIPPKVKQGVWVIVLILALIALLSIIAGGGRNPFPGLKGKSDRTPATVPIETARYHTGALT